MLLCTKLISNHFIFYNVLPDTAMICTTFKMTLSDVLIAKAMSF